MPSAWLVEVVVNDGIQRTMRLVVEAFNVSQACVFATRYIGDDDFVGITSVQKVAEHFVSIKTAHAATMDAASKVGEPV